MRSLNTLAVLFCALPLLMQAGAPSAAGTVLNYERYRDWLVACDNGLRCEAKGVEDRRPYTHLSILREPGPEGALRVTIGASFRFAPSELMLDGAPLDFADPAWTLERHGSQTLLTTTQADAALAFIARIRNGDQLSFGDRRARIPLAGLTAALLRVDEIQQQLGVRTALIHKGPRSIGTVPPPALPRFEPTGSPAPLDRDEEDALLSAVQQFHNDPLDSYCYGSMHLMTSVAPRAWPIDEEHALVAIPCTLTSFQQVLAFVYVVERRPGGAIEHFQPTMVFSSQSHPARFRALSEPDFDPATGRLYAAQKTLDHALCGHAGEWQWQNGRFVLARFARQDRCGGAIPGDWPVVYRSEMSAP